mmetsp:Transcript_305/g.686  ORF Transcript_305/g.686 Transcript_305/m.686 type:complete len:262 (-) Transcript_305:723-1508(-)
MRFSAAGGGGTGVCSSLVVGPCEDRCLPGSISAPLRLNSAASLGSTHSVEPSVAVTISRPHFPFQPVGSSVSSSASDFLSGSLSFSPSGSPSAGDAPSNFSDTISSHRASTCCSRSGSFVRLLICPIASSFKSLTIFSCASTHSPATALMSGMGRPLSLPATAATLSIVRLILTYGSALATHALGNTISKPSPSLVAARESHRGSMKKTFTRLLSQSCGLFSVLTHALKTPCFLWSSAGRNTISLGASLSTPLSSVIIIAR